MTVREKKTILALEQDQPAFEPFYSALASAGELHVFPTLDRLLAEEGQHEAPVYLLDVVALRDTPTALVTQLLERRSRVPMGLVTSVDSDEYLVDLRRWGLLQVAIKNIPVHADEVRLFVNSLCDPLNGFGLPQYLSGTMEMYNLSIHNIREKNEAIERVINHFATANFNVHELYDVRLILEETLNNSFFHAFRTATGEEKYSLHAFRQLEPHEKVRIEYGNNARLAGFTVTDNAGTLSIRTILNKLERQLNREGLHDSSGRGLYLSRMLSTAFVINIEEARRTQLVALFDERRRMQRPKPFMINFVGSDSFAEWRLDPDFD